MRDEFLLCGIHFLLSRESGCMLSYALLGMTYAFAAAVQPGPLQSYLISQTLAHGWRKTLPAACAPLITDGPILLVVLFVLRVLPVWSLSFLQCAGGLFLLFLAYQTWKMWKNYSSETAAGLRTSRRTLLQAIGVNILNPAPYLGWSLVMGPLFLTGWNDHPAFGAALLAGFYSTIVVCQMCIIVAFAHAAKLGSNIVRAMIGISSLVLALFGAYQIWKGVLLIQTVFLQKTL